MAKYRELCWTCDKWKVSTDFGADRTQCKKCLKAKREEYIQRIGPEVYKARCRAHMATYRAKLRAQRAIK